MINEPSVDALIRKLGTEEEPISRYALCTIAAKRARQIIETERKRSAVISQKRFAMTYLQSYHNAKHSFAIHAPFWAQFTFC